LEAEGGKLDVRRAESGRKYCLEEEIPYRLYFFLFDELIMLADMLYQKSGGLAALAEHSDVALDLSSPSHSRYSGFNCPETVSCFSQTHVVQPKAMMSSQDTKVPHYWLRVGNIGPRLSRDTLHNCATVDWPRRWPLACALVLFPLLEACDGEMERG
jgi:hypothetical protein